MKQQQIFLIFCLWIWSNLAWGQQFETRLYHMAQGVVSEYGKEIVQDSTGFLWFNTESGISRFDGNNFLNFKVYASDIALTSYGLLVTTQEGLFQICHTPDTVFFQNLMPHQIQNSPQTLYFPNQIFEDTHKNIWIVEKQGIAQLDWKNKRVRQRFTFENLPQFIIQAHPDLVHFFTTEGLIYVWSLKENRFLNVDNQLFSAISTVYSPAPLEIWVGNSKITKLKIRDDGKLVLERSSEPFPNDITAIIRTRAGKTYVGTSDNTGFEILTDSLAWQKMHFLKASSTIPTALSEGKLHQLFEDKFGNLWAISTEGQSKHRRKIFTSPYYFPHQYTGAVCITENGHKYLATNNLYRLEEIQQGIFTTQAINLSERHRHQMTMGCSVGNDLWYGTKTGFLVHIRDGKIVKELDLREFGEYIYEVFADSAHQLWVCQVPKPIAPPHLLRISAADYTIKKYDAEEGILGRPLQFRAKNQMIYCSAIGAKNYLFRYDKKTDKFVNLSQKLPLKNTESFEVHDFMPDDKGGFYMATTHGFLYQDAQNKLQRKDQTWHLTDEVRAVGMDTKQNIWVATAMDGVFVYSPENEQVVRYTNQNGLASKILSYRGITLDPTGRIWVATTEGVSYVQENTSEIYSTPKPIFLYVKMNGKKIQLTDNQVFPHDSYMNLAFRIAGMQRENIQFEHRLVQQGNEAKTPWHSTSDGVDFYVDEFSAGQHRFEVRAKRLGNYAYSPTLVFEFEILPVWYKTHTFMALLLIFIALSVWISVYFYRLRVRKRQQKLEVTIQARTKKIMEQQVILEKNNQNLQGQKQEVQAQKEELLQQQEEIMSQRDFIETKNIELEEQQEELRRQHEKIEKAFKNIRTISNIGQQITATLNLEKAIGILYRELNEIMDAEDFGVGLYDAQTQKIHYQFYIKKSERVPSFSTSIQENRFSAWVIQHQKPVYINDLENEYTNYLTSLEGSGKHEGEHQSIISLPLKVENRLIGLLTIRSSNRNAYEKQYFILIQALGSYVATALDNTQTYSALEVANQEIRQQRKNMYDSMRYARHIQQSILPTDELGRYFTDYFIIYRPKDIVSGDFYWIAEIDNQLFVSVADCTGHGVPGGLMSMIGNTLLREAVYISGIYSPAKILEQLHHGVRTILHKDSEKDSDGMDISILKIEKYSDQSQHRITFADAKSSILYIENEELKAKTCNRRSIAGYTRNRTPFQEIEFEVPKNTAFYMFSDGYASQMSPQNRRFGTVNLRQLIFKYSQAPMRNQKRKLIMAFREHQDTEEQRDDVTILGFRI